MGSDEQDLKYNFSFELFSVSNERNESAYGPEQVKEMDGGGSNV